MKNEAIAKINKIGKVGNVFAVIARVCVVIALVCTIIGTVVIGLIPKDLFSISVGVNTMVNVNLNRIEDQGVVNSEQSVQEVIDAMVSEITGSEENEFVVVDEGNESGILTIEANTDFPQVVTLNHIFWILVCMDICLAVLTVTLVFVGRLCKAFKNCESPFEENVIKKMTQLAWALTPWVVLNSLLEGCGNALSLGNDGIDIGVDPMMLFVVLLVWGLVIIFKYGAVLQQESDETL